VVVGSGPGVRAAPLDSAEEQPAASSITPVAAAMIERRLM
jgi:hypothetical protein